MLITLGRIIRKLGTGKEEEKKKTGKLAWEERKGIERGGRGDPHGLTRGASLLVTEKTHKENKL